MRKLIMWNVITLDGCFEGTGKWDLPWHQRVWGEELEHFSLEQLRAADMLVMGRVTYEGMAAHWQTATGAIAEYMNSLPKIVCSRTLKSARWNNTRLISRNAAAEIGALKRQGDGNMYVFGSADLSASLMNAALFDEYRLGIAPVIAGNGAPLFRQGPAAQDLALLEARSLSNGCVILRYQSR
jgi:dihydrofolate reductase